MRRVPAHRPRGGRGTFRALVRRSDSRAPPLPAGHVGPPGGLCPGGLVAASRVCRHGRRPSCGTSAGRPGPLNESSEGDRYSPPRQPPPASGKPSYDTAYAPSYSVTECLSSLITAELSVLHSELYAEESAECPSSTSPDLYAYLDTSSSVDVAFALSTLLTSDVSSSVRKHSLQSGVIAVDDVVSTSVHHEGDASVYADVDTDWIHISGYRCFSSVAGS
jgi:hypothetical protein